jgi:hypothetical protein
MKAKQFTLITILILLLLSACGGEVTPTSSPDDVLSTINTEVALTSMALQSQVPTNQVVVTATLTPLPLPTATLIASLPTATLSSSSSSIGSSSACDNSVYVSDVTIPDGTVFEPNEPFTKTWGIQNTGTCTWSSNYNIIFSSGEDMSGEATSIGQSVAPGSKAEISVELIAPESDGTYTSYWILENGSGTAFGGYVYVQIVVSTGASTNTPTSTPASVTSTNLPTSVISTITTLATSTNAPTNTTSPIAESTPTPES